MIRRPRRSTLFPSPPLFRSVVEYAGTPFTIFRRGRRRYPLKHVVLLAPVLPSKIVGIGPNYRDHAAELGLAIPDEPVMLLRSEEHTSELQSQSNLVCRLLLE